MGRHEEEIPVGTRFGRLVVIGRGKPNKFGHCRLLTLCDCGNQKEVLKSNLKNGHTQSCSCLRREQMVARNHEIYRLAKEAKERGENE